LIKAKGLHKLIEPEGTEDTSAVSDSDSDGDENKSAPKRPKVAPYEIPTHQLTLIKKDRENTKKWVEVVRGAAYGEQAFFNKLVENFTCPICRSILYRPVALACHHSLCLICFNKARRSALDCCPFCREDFAEDEGDLDGTKYENLHLQAALNSLVPGYAKNREGKEKKSFFLTPRKPAESGEGKLKKKGNDK